jgi:L-ascorbate metabolism protein UlaG (beta-lactamase superfamily)
MQITRWPQSCLVIEESGSRLCIDPGTLVTARFGLEDLGHLDAVLYTHRHPDHLDPDLVERLLEQDVALYGNHDVVELLGDHAVTPVRDGEKTEVAGVEILPRDLPHVPLVDGSPGPPNTGFLVADVLFHPGDGLSIEGLRVPNLAAPISGPSISFRDAYAMVEALGADTVIPIHHDHFVADANHFAQVCDIAKVVVLEHGESTRIG